jgi:glyoxylase-like metal-dependent hydrolase (beta-lactamase superfamily II)
MFFRNIILITLLSVLSFGMDYGLKPIKISSNVHCFFGINDMITKKNGGNIANTYWINTGKHYVVVDTGASYEYAKQSHIAMKKVADLPIKMVFNTHAHDDHWMGNAYFKEKNIPIYGTANQVKLHPLGSDTRITRILDKKDLNGTKVVKIDNIVNKNQTITVDDKKIELIYLGYKAHTSEDYMVYFPSESVLFTNDLLFSERLTSVRDGSIEGNLKAIAQIEKINPKIYANGHGKYTDKTAINQMKEYLGDLKKSSLEAIEEDIGLDEFVKSGILDAKYSKYEMFDILHKQNMDFAYREYEFY